MLTLRVSEDNLIRWDKMQKASDGAYVNDASVTFTLKDASNVAVTGASAVTMPYVSGTDGRYQGILESTVSLTEGSHYWLEITATSGTINGFRRMRATALYHGEVD